MTSMRDMEVEFNITAEDKYQYHLEQLVNPGPLRKIYLALLFAGPVIAAFVAGYLGWHRIIESWGIVLVFLAFSVAISGAAYLHFHWETRRHIKRHFIPTASKLRITNEGMTIEREQIELSIRWDMVKELVNIEPECIIRIDYTIAIQPICIPYHSFGDRYKALRFLETARRLKFESTTTSTSPTAVTDSLRVKASLTADDYYRYYLGRIHAPGAQRWEYYANYLIGPGICAYFIVGTFTEDVYYSLLAIILITISIITIFSVAVYYTTHEMIRRRIRKEGNLSPVTLILRKEGLHIIMDKAEQIIRWQAINGIRLSKQEGILAFEIESSIIIAPMHNFKSMEHAIEFYTAAVKYKNSIE
jgi:hypothetical protein